MTVQGDIVGSVNSATNTAPIVVTASEPHGLKDKDEVKIAGVTGNEAANWAFYVKVSGESDTRFELYCDKELTKPVEGTGEYKSGGTIYRPFPEDYAIIVGINVYHVPALPSLHAPEIDALRFRNWLISPMGGKVAMDKTKLIISSDPRYPASDPNDPSTWQPALGALNLAFRKYSDLAFVNELNKGKSRVGRRLYIFLAGHGITPAKAATPDLDEAALLTASASLQAPGEHLLGYAWANWFRNAAAFDDIFLFMDCCRELKNNVTPIPPIAGTLVSKDRDSVRFFYAAGTELDSQSWEQDFGSPPQRHGVFSYALMEALENEAISDSEGQLTGVRLAEYLNDRVPKLREDQRPKLEFHPLKNLILVQRRDFKPNLRVIFDRSCFGQDIQLYSGDDVTTPLTTHRADGNPWCLQLKRKLYKLSTPNCEPKLFELDVSLKEPTDVKFP
jgi:uncharacterized caspase-like protein